MSELYQQLDRKFLDIIQLEDIEIETDTGWQPISAIAKTIAYLKYYISTTDGLHLECADDHILFRPDFIQVFAKDLRPGDKIVTQNGISEIYVVLNTHEYEEMFDVEVASIDHRYFSGGFLSHNTSMINALCYALFNKPFGNISLERLINRTNNSKNTQMEVRLAFSKDGVDYEILRSRGAEYTISLIRDGVDITPGKGVTECDNLILDVIGISYELFTRIIVFSGTSVDFLQLPISKQRSLIEELFGISILSEKAKLLKELITNTSSDIKICEAVIKQQETSNKLYKTQVADAIRRVELWDKQNASEIKNIQLLLEQVNNVNFEEEQTLRAQREHLQEDISIITTSLRTSERERVNLISSNSKDREELSHLENSKCPYCLQDFQSAQDKIATLKEKILSKINRAQELDNEIQNQQTKLTDLRAAQEEIKSNIKYENFSELLNIKTNIVQNQTKLHSLQSAGNPHLEPLQKLFDQGEVEIEFSKLDLLKERLDHQQFLLKLLTDKNSFLRQKIISKNIPFLNKRLNAYTIQLGLPHIVKFDADMSCVVSEFGRELDYDNLSQGEKKRVSTSLMLAFRDMYHHLRGRDNLLFIDELDGGAMDIPGIDAIVRLIKQVTRDEDLSAFIISHHPAVVGRFDQTLLVRKEQGFSSVCFE